MKIAFLILVLIVFNGCGADRQKFTNASKTEITNSRVEPGPPQALSVSGSAENQKVLDVVKRIVGKDLELDPRSIDSDTPLSKLGADGLDAVEIIMKIDEFFNVEIKDEDVGGSDISQLPNLTIRALAEIVIRTKAASANPPSATPFSIQSGRP